MRGKRGLGGIEMADIVLGGVFRASSVEDLQHLMFQCLHIGALLDDIVLMEDMAEEVPVIERPDDRVSNGFWQRLEPITVVAAECHVERDDILDLSRMDRTIADSRTRDREAVEKGCCCLLGCAFEIVA